MKTILKTSILSALLLLPGAVPELAAVPRQWRAACGTVQEVHPKTRTFGFRADDGRVLVIKWNSRTVSYRNGQRIKEPMLKTGQRVCLHYRSPLFGKRWATRITWPIENAEIDP